MKRFYINLIAGLAVMLLIRLFLDYFPAVFFKNSGVPALPLLLLSAMGVAAGLIIALPRLIALLQSNKGMQFNREIITGQGIPAMLLAFNAPIVKSLAGSAVPETLYSWLGRYPAPFSLAGFLWLGIIIIETLSPQPVMFHVKQRRRKH